MTKHEADTEVVTSVNLMCRYRISLTLLRSRPSGSGQYVLYSTGDNSFALCRIALSAGEDSRLNEHLPIKATVTLQRDTRSFKELQSFLLAHTKSMAIDSAVRDNNELLWISRGAVRAAVVVTLELVAESDSQLQHQLLQDADTRFVLRQTLQRHFVICNGARVRLPTLKSLAAESRGEKNENLKLCMTFQVVSTHPSQVFVRVTPSTRVTLTYPDGYVKHKEENKTRDSSTRTDFESQYCKKKEMGGMEKERAALRELILLPVVHPRLRSEMGMEFPKGVLLCGPPGVGKTLLVRSVVNDCRQVKGKSGAILDLKLQVINGSEIMTSGRGDAEQALRTTFEKAVVHARSAQHAASVIFIDELDALCPKREAAGRGVSSAHDRIVAQLLTLLDGVEGRVSLENVVIIAATNLPNSIDPALRRPGRLDREFFVSPPNIALRKKIFKVHLMQTPYALSSGSSESTEQIRDIFLNTLASKAVGYVGADIVALCREAAMVASMRELVVLSQNRELERWWADWKRKVEPLSIQNLSTKFESIVAGRAWHATPCAILPLWFLARRLGKHDASKAESGQQQLSQHQYFRFLLDKSTGTQCFAPTCPDKATDAQTFEVTMEDFDQAMQTVGPSSLRGVSGYTKDYERHGWDRIGGQANAKLALQQALEWPVKFPQTFARLGVKPPRGILLYGPPGCSKSSIVRAAAHTSGATFLSLSAAQVFSPFFGDAEAAVRQVFRDARAALPAIIFFDEIDVLVTKREFDGSNDTEGGTSTAMRVLSTMLNEMDGVESAEGLLVIGATNRPACIDAALMRPGRFDRIQFVDLPMECDRVDILTIHSRSMQLHDDVDLYTLAKRTPYFSGAELENLCREAALLALRESLEAKNVRMSHFDKALHCITPVSSEDSMRDYITFAKAMGHLS